VLNVQGGETSPEREDKQLSRKSSNTGNVALGLLLLVLAYFVYPNENLAAIGVGLVGLYLIVKR
jgi:hypothetical protein